MLSHHMRIGIIGTGFGAVQAQAFSLHPKCRVIACSGVNRLERAQALANQMGIPAAYQNYREMLEHEDLDLVSVVSMPDLHHEMAIAALERRIPVLCEKPMAMNLAEANAMRDAAERRGLLACVDFEFRYIPVRAKFKELVSGGFLGELVHFNLTWTRGALEKNKTRPMGWLWRPESGGGILGAWGSHLIDLVRWSFGEIHSVAGSLTTHVEEREGQRAVAEDTFTFLVKLAGKATGVVQYLTHAQHGFGFRLEAFGTEGTLVLTDDVLQAGRRGEPLKVVPTAARFELPGVVYPENVDPHVPSLLALIDRLTTALSGGQCPDLPTFTDGAAVQAVLDAVRQSHAEGRWVEVRRA